MKKIALPRSKDRYKSILWLILAILCTSLIAIGAIHFSKASYSVLAMIRNSPLRQQIFAALIGSIFGALLGSIASTVGIVLADRLRERRNRDHERRVKHYNSIVILQRQMNIIRATMEDNTSAIKTIIEANDVGLPTFQRSIEIITDESHFEDLYDIILINMLNQLYYDIRRLNLDSVNLTRTLDELADQRLSGKITGVEYTREVLAFRPQIVRVREYILEKLDHEVLDILAYVRICADRDASTEMKKRFKRLHKNRMAVTDEDIQHTRQEILKELEGSENKARN